MTTTITKPTMTTWVITYNDHSSDSSSVMAAQAEVYAAYYAAEGNLVEFKDSQHQVVFSLPAGIVQTIRRDDTVKPAELNA